MLEYLNGLFLSGKPGDTIADDFFGYLKDGRFHHHLEVAGAAAMIRHNRQLAAQVRQSELAQRPKRVLVMTDSVSILGVGLNFPVSHARGFEQAGCEVRTLFGQENYNPEKIIDTVIRFDPDLVVLYHVDALHSQHSFSNIRICYELGVSVALLFFDNPFYSLTGGLTERDHLDLVRHARDTFKVYAFDRVFAEELRLIGVDCEVLMHALDDTVFTHMPPPVEYQYDVSMVGSLDWLFKYKGADKHPMGPPETGRLATRVLTERLIDFGSTTTRVLEDLGVTFEDVFDGVITRTRIRFANQARSAIYRRMVLNDLVVSPLHVFGSKDDGHGRFVHHPPVEYTKELPELFNLSKINLHINSIQNETTINSRIFDAGGVGAFLLTDFNEDLLLLGRDLAREITFRTSEEMNRKVEYFLGREDERLDIAKRMHDVVLHDHTYRHRAEQMLSAL